MSGPDETRAQLRRLVETQAAALREVTAQRDALREAAQALFDDIGYVCDRDGCECGDYVEHGECCHTQAFAALAAVKATEPQ